jgi:hypothetical protein
VTTNPSLRAVEFTPPVVPASPYGSDGVVVSEDGLFGLLDDICAYRNRRQQLLTGTLITSTEISALEALDRKLRADRAAGDRRFAYQRFGCTTPAVLSFEDDGPRVAVRIRNISADGAGIEHGIELRAGQSIGLSVAVALPRELVSFRFHGRIVWAKPIAAGIMFAGCVESSVRPLDTGPEAGAILPVVADLASRRR